MIKDIKKTIASANINFLIGAGLSSPFLEILQDIESRLEAETEENEVKKEYFKKCIKGNLDILRMNKIENDFNNVSYKCKKYMLKKILRHYKKVFQMYQNFYKNINHIVLKRESSLLSKQINIFTTNIDIFSEMALEKSGIDFNDGFHGRFNPKYDVSNFKKSYYKTSLHYEKMSEIPVFNILKLHGSVSWQLNGKAIELDKDLKQLEDIKKNFDEEFGEYFDKLMIVNPNKKKFEYTLLNQTYYDLLRIYSNELEKENSVLFVMGFSFADEHIKNLTLRVANSNPTLKVYIFSYKKKKSKEYKKLGEAKNCNVEIIVSDNDKKYDFNGINSFFKSLLKSDEQQAESTEVENTNE